MKRASILAVCLFVACGGSNNNGNGDDDNSQTDASTGSGSGSGSGSGNGSGSGSGIAPGVYAIPLTTPDDSFWAPTLTVGSQQFVMDLDTGSTSVGIAGSTCTSCTGLSPLYTPGSTATDQDGSASTEYADNSGWSGEIYQDTIALENGSPNAQLNLVDITAQTGGFFSGNVYQGILGMGSPENAEPNTGAYFNTITTTSGVTPIMAFELCAKDGTMWLGGFDQTHASAAPAYTPMEAISDNQPFYSIDITGASLGSAALTDATATDLTDWVVDTGTTLFYIPTPMLTALIKDINANTSFKTLFPGSTFKNSSTAASCTKKGTTTVTDAQVESMLPSFTMTMKNAGGGADITVTAGPLESYLYDNGDGTFCLGAQDGGTGSQAEVTMGDQILQGFVSIIDLKNQQVGWAPDAYCAVNGAKFPAKKSASFHPHLPKPHHPNRAH
jgi:hypothetical protein